MRSLFEIYFLSKILFFCSASYHEQYRVPHASSERWESYVYNDREYIIQNLPVSWENAGILCRGHHNSSLAVLDTREKAEFLAEALSESQLLIESVWVDARRLSADDPSGYKWSHGVELRRTGNDILASEDDRNLQRHYPVWLNRTRVPVPEAGADCVALERVDHDRPVFLDLPCLVERPFACERTAQVQIRVSEVKAVRCRTGLYRLYDGRMDWNQAAAFCILKKMSLANIATMRCLKKLGMTMLKNRPSIENAWVGAKGTLGKWSWVDSGISILHPPLFPDEHGEWPPMRDRNNIKQSGCLQLDRHSSHPPVFLEARCERKMQFICYEGISAPSLLRTSTAPPSDDFYYYVLVKQQLYWQNAYDNCHKLNGTLASIDSSDILVQLLLVMGENKDQPINHIWISGRLNMSRDINTDVVNYMWHNPSSGKRIPDPKTYPDLTTGLYMAPWLDEDFNMDSPCLNLDRQDHLSGLVYGLPCDTPQYSVCMVEKTNGPTTSVERPTQPIDSN